VLLVALTGGIGSGKSTVARLLQAHGAVVMDADDLARAAIGPGTPGMVKVLDHFGPSVLTPDASAVDREALARVVFADPAERRVLESIVHPVVARSFAEAIETYRGTDRVVVYAVPLLVEEGLAGGFDAVVTISATADTRVARLAADRGMQEADARARMAAQTTDAERERVAHEVLRNDGSLRGLAAQVDALWERLAARARGGLPAHPISAEAGKTERSVRPFLRASGNRRGSAREPPADWQHRRLTEPGSRPESSRPVAAKQQEDVAGQWHAYPHGGGGGRVSRGLGERHRLHAHSGPGSRRADRV
jgi:dephospho-CoA kinase